MENKICIGCNIEKPLSDFYKHKKMADGHLNKCKECKKRDTKDREEKLREDPNWVDSERERHREKYHRLGYKDKHKPSSEKKKEIMKRYNDRYPEKKIARDRTSHMKPSVLGNHLHHWSYNEEHLKDVIELSVKDHNTAHRHMIYDQERMMYRTKDGVLLDTRESHLRYLSTELGIKF